MPVTKTAKRALRSSAKKAQANFLRIKDLQKKKMTLKKYSPLLIEQSRKISYTKTKHLE